jgi:hypothetical protein
MKSYIGRIVALVVASALSGSGYSMPSGYRNSGTAGVELEYQGTQDRQAPKPKLAKPRRPSATTSDRDRGSLKGSPTSMDEQNRVASAHDLSRIPDNESLHRMIKSGYLVKVPRETQNYYLDDDLPARRRHDPDDPLIGRHYARPYTKLFLDRLSRQYRAACGERLKVTSLTRTKEDQAQLTNGSKRSVHPTGAAIDLGIGKCAEWLGSVLSGLDKKGYIEATREKRPPHFHIMVYPTYHQYVQKISGRASSQKVGKR